MFWPLKWGRVDPVGIDIRPGEIRLARVRRLSGGQHAVLLADIGRVSSESFSAIDWLEMKQLMGVLVKRHRLSGLPAVISLPTGCARQQEIQLPVSMKPHAMEAEIHVRLYQAASALADPVCMDYVVMPSGNPLVSRVFFAAVSQALLAEYVDCAASAGLIVKIVDLDHDAMKRAFQSQTAFLLRTTRETDDMFCQHASSLMTAIGLAMREMPAW